MIGSIAQGYATRALLSVTGKVLGLVRGEEAESSQGSSPGTSGKAGPDTITLTDKGRLLAANQLLLPTADNIQALSTTLSRNIAALLAKEGISSSPAFEVDVDERTMAITVTGDRTDTAAIAKVLNGDETVRSGIQTLAAISSHAAGMSESLNFQKEYRASSDPESVVARYASLFGQQKGVDISLRFDGTNIAVLANGKEYLPG